MTVFKPDSYVRPGQYLLQALLPQTSIRLSLRSATQDAARTSATSIHSQLLAGLAINEDASNPSTISTFSISGAQPTFLRARTSVNLMTGLHATSNSVSSVNDVVTSLQVLICCCNTCGLCTLILLTRDSTSLLPWRKSHR